MAQQELPQYKTDFLHAALEGGALRFGTFELKSKRQSPYFFNAGSFFTGSLHAAIVDAFASTIISSSSSSSSTDSDNTLDFDVIFGPAYKGIPLAAGVLYALARRDPARFGAVGYAFDRKEAKDHGEGGTLVGAPLRGKRVLVIDDVVSSGTAKRQAVDLIRAAGGTVAGIVVALDRQETLPPPAAGADGSGSKSDERTSAIGELRREYGIPIVAIVRLEDIITGMRGGAIAEDDIRRMEEYRAKYGASD
ncbi:orotate phosphoribosyltransferase [Diatrype stigma]|uniref:Orotate phosphoribosyltransferase n=1 Tax=Diatrype stigma TaxID=117547 RepID=A0AAN9UUT5_9PEZI